MEPGKLRHRVTLKTYSNTAGADGSLARTNVWSVERWGLVEPVSVEERRDNAAVFMDATHKVTLRRMKPSSIRIDNSVRATLLWDTGPQSLTFEIIGIMEHIALAEHTVMLLKWRAVDW